jgi:hypothetical protein
MTPGQIIFPKPRLSGSSHKVQMHVSLRVCNIKSFFAHSVSITRQHILYLGLLIEDNNGIMTSEPSRECVACRTQMHVMISHSACTRYSTRNNIKSFFAHSVSITRQHILYLGFLIEDNNGIMTSEPSRECVACRTQMHVMISNSACTRYVHVI